MIVYLQYILKLYAVIKNMMFSLVKKNGAFKPSYLCSGFGELSCYMNPNVQQIHLNALQSIFLQLIQVCRFYFYFFTIQ